MLVTTNDPLFTYTQNVSADKHILKLGVNYLFDWGRAPAANASMAAYAFAPAASATYDWTGFYAGITAGGGVLLDAGWQFLADEDRHGVGALAGGQVGYNYQMGMFVVGVEGEGFWSSIGNKVDQFGGNTLLASTRIKNKADVDIAARFGLAFNRALVYGKAGWAWDHFTWDSADIYGDTANASATLNGLLMGLGLEYGHTNNWTAKFEYDYIGFNAKDVLAMANDGSTFTQSVSAEKHIFKLGVNYLFGMGR